MLEEYFLKWRRRYEKWKHRNDITYETIQELERMIEKYRKGISKN